MRTPTLLCLLVLGASSTLRAQERIKIVTLNTAWINQDENDTVGLLTAVYRNGTIDTLYSLRWNAETERWHYQVGTEWLTPKAPRNHTDDIMYGITEIAYKYLGLSGLEPGKIMKYSGSKPWLVAYDGIEKLRVSGLQQIREGSQTLTFDTFGSVVKDVSPFRTDLTSIVRDSAGRPLSLQTTRIKDGDTEIIDREYYEYDNGVLKSAVQSYTHINPDSTAILHHFEWDEPNAEDPFALPLPFEFGGNRYRKVTTERSDNGYQYVWDGYKEQQFFGPQGQVTYTRDWFYNDDYEYEPFSGDALSYYPNGDFRFRAHYQFQTHKDRPYWTAEDRNSYNADGTVDTSAYYSDGRLAWIQYFHYGIESSSIARHDNERKPRSQVVYDRLILPNEIMVTEATLIDVVGRVHELRVTIGSAPFVDIAMFSPGYYLLRVDGITYALLKV